MFLPLIFGKISFLILVYELLLAGVIVLIFGTLLSRYGDIIAETSGLGGAWIGITIIAMLTSIPEMAVAISSVTIHKDPNLGIGDLFGACAYNLVIISIMDLIQGQGALTREIRLSHILPASLGIIILGLAVMGIIGSMAMQTYASVMSLFSSFFIFFAYLIGTKMIFRLEQSEKAESMEEELYSMYKKPPKLYLKFTICAIILAAAGCWLSTVAQKIANIPITWGSSKIILGTTFVGSLMLSLLTTTPELVVSISAFKIGAVDMAVANVLGSNMVNVSIIFLMELVSGTKGVFTNIDKRLLIPAIMAIIETSILISGLIYRSKRSFLLMGLDNLALFAFYLIGNWLLFRTTVQRL